MEAEGVKIEGKRALGYKGKWEGNREEKKKEREEEEGGKSVEQARIRREREGRQQRKRSGR